ncbi:ribosome modulation factor [Methylobacterium iners]|uniref:Ribosome modulation factor n=1 Tax=Methylobacterium iners TaxID=418707 RepID=A0ABQ4RTN1_9HYPH|nr:Rmf/CrpP family protein [Methylobacterium iners]GJD94146.1 hypothetical protein OCOJLMKI_1348 [Methylobacterium iners]
MADPQNPSTDPIAQGARAHALGRPRDACPYPAGSEERAAWLEGYDGTPRDREPDLQPGAG